MKKMNSAIRPSVAVLALGVGVLSLGPMMGACSSEPKSAADIQKKNTEQNARLDEAKAIEARKLAEWFAKVVGRG